MSKNLTSWVEQIYQDRQKYIGKRNKHKFFEYVISRNVEIWRLSKMKFWKHFNKIKASLANDTRKKG